MKKGLINKEPIIRSRVFFKENLNLKEPVIYDRKFGKTANLTSHDIAEIIDMWYLSWKDKYHCTWKYS